MRRVAITGVGVISPLGNNSKDFFRSLLSGQSGVKRINAAFAGNLSIKIAAQIQFNPTDYFPKKQANQLDRAAQLLLVAAQEAAVDAAIDAAFESSGADKKRAGVFIGTGMGGAQSIDEMYMQVYKNNAARVNPLLITRIMANSPASHVSMQYGLKGPCLTYSIACSSSGVAIGEAFRSIKHGYTDVAFAGGTESLITLGSMKCWESLGVLASEDPQDAAASCKPFSKDRSGFVLGEGAAIIILEEMERAARRGANIYAELSGYGSTADAAHITSPSVDGQAHAMRLAMEEAGVTEDEIDYINAHGTATITNDVVETEAIKKVFGPRAYKIPVSSTKSMHGHLLGAAGAVEFAASVLAIKNRAIPPTANLKSPDPDCDLDYVSEGARKDVNVKIIMSNSFAFGGTNAVLVARRAR